MLVLLLVVLVAVRLMVAIVVAVAAVRGRAGAAATQRTRRGLHWVVDVTGRPLMVVVVALVVVLAMAAAAAAGRLLAVIARRVRFAHDAVVAAIAVSVAVADRRWSAAVHAPVNRRDGEDGSLCGGWVKLFRCAPADAASTRRGLYQE